MALCIHYEFLMEACLLLCACVHVYEDHEAFLSQTAEGEVGLLAKLKGTFASFIALGSDSIP